METIMSKLTTTLLLAALLPATSFADFIGGNKLLANCTNEGTEIVDLVERGYCPGYITGISDAHAIYVMWGNMANTLYNGRFLE